MDKYNNKFITPEGDMEMKKHLNIDNTRIQKMLDIKLKIFNKEITPVDARRLVNETFDKVSAEEFAYGEQHLFNAGITDEIMAEGMDNILDVFKDVLVVDNLNLPKGHPIQTYADEAAELELLLLKMEQKLKVKFIKNEWLDLYTQLSEINTHFSRKQHQLFSALERKGFDRPSRIMWTFDDRVRDTIKDAYVLLQTDKDDDFIEAQPHVIHLVRDILGKERDVLYPTSLKLLSDDEFVEMRKGDDEIGYCLIENPPAYYASSKGIVSTPELNNKNNLLTDLKDVLAKHGLTTSPSKDEVLDVSNGKLTLEQINLIYKHMQIDLSYVDENDIVKFYTDSTHRVFPRSPGVIGREVQNCHPRNSLSTVNAIVDAFRKGEQDEAEFWIDKGDKFIYIIFNAVRDEEGNFKGVLEMMQDVTHIRSLKGSRRLLSWENSKPHKENELKPNTNNMNSERATNSTTDIQIDIEPKTVIGVVISQYPFIKDFLVSLSPDYNRLTNPVLFKTMKNIATIDMISKVGGFKVDHLIKLIKQEIEDKQ